MSNQDDSQGDIRPRTPPSNTRAQATRTKQNSLTPRNPKDRGGIKPQHHLRTAIARSMKHEILHCPLEEFLNHYAPFAPSSEYVENAYKQVKDTCLLGHPREPPGDDGLSWASFDGDSPSEIAAPEAKVFGRLAEIVEVLEELDPPSTSRRLNFRYRDAPYNKIQGEIPGSTFKMDACIQPCETLSDTICSANTAVVAEFKKKAGRQDIRDNRLKVVSAASHIMNDDPRRKWMYGITVENEKMSLWYFSRSHSVKSYEFDFTREFKNFIRVFVSFLFAEEEEMGFDPTVRRVEIEGQHRYVYQVGGRFFLTQQHIFNPRVLCISGRKTRVWSVVEVGGYSGKGLMTVHNDGKKYALKDVWLDKDSPTEGEILGQVFGRLGNVVVEQTDWMPDELYKQLESALSNQQYKRYFMNILCHNKGQCSKSVAVGARADPQILDLTTPDMTDEQMKSSTLKSSTQTPVASNFSGRMQPSNEPQDRDYKVKQQYRLVYADVGIPLHDSPDLASSFQAIYDTFIALFLMYLAGWVHRDISTGNIILVKAESGRFIGKLSDLEYAKVFSTESVGSKDPKTGTPYFMPWEVHSSQSLHKLDPVLRPEFLYNAKISRIPRLSRSASSMVKWPPFYRFDYDLESVWWVILWSVLYPIPHTPAQRLSQQVFTHGSTPSFMRTQIFTVQEHISLSDAMHPELESLTPFIQELHFILYASYRSIPKDRNEYMLYYTGFWKILHPLLSLVQDIDEFRFVVPDSEILPSQTQEKRQLEAYSDDEGDGAGNGNADREGSHKRPRVQHHAGHPSQFVHRIYTS